MTKKKTTEQFILEAKTIHGDKYDYKEVEYKNGRTKVKIYCFECNTSFEQIPNSHLRGRGCPACYGNVNKTTEQFILEAQLVHDDKFDYSDVEYKNNRSKIKIYCFGCNTVFEQTPDGHLQGQGCPTCNATKKTTERFILEAQAIHGNKYNYSCVEYKNNATKVKIYCFECCIYFEQTPSVHLRGSGCSACSCYTKKKTTEQFILEARTIHGNKYDYKEVEYKCAHTKIKIHCLDCDTSFEQKPNNHLNGHGCLACGGKVKKTTEQFIEQAQFVHGNKYDYSDVEYKNTDTKVKIYCFGCNTSFDQTPDSHLRGDGCLTCSGKVKKTNEQFTEQARLVHGSKYDYSDIEYKNTDTKVKIYCFGCNTSFDQTPDSHLQGSGCPRCNNSRGYSDASVKWLESLLPQYPTLQYAKTETGEYKIPGTRFKVDGFVEEYNLVFEYMGCYWHACRNPSCKSYRTGDTIHPDQKITYQEVYENTKERIRILREKGYEIMIQWECNNADWLDD